MKFGIINISEIKKFPTNYINEEGQKCHESLLQSFQILNKIEEMLERKDSQETILEIIKDIRYNK